MTQKQAMALVFNTSPNEWIPLPVIMKVGAQYNTRISELRADGYTIVNKTKMVDGKKHSWYIYTPPEAKVEYKKEGNQLAFV